MDIIHLKDVKDSGILALIAASAKAREKAYNCYSNFAVGAALLCSEGQVITGCNVENVSFGLTICAERTAIVKAISEGHHEFTSIAVSAVSNSPGFAVTPCGACRQFLVEFNPHLKVYLYDPKTDVVGLTDMNYLLPHAVLPNNMNLTINDNHKS